VLSGSRGRLYVYNVDIETGSETLMWAYVYLMKSQMSLINMSSTSHSREEKAVGLHWNNKEKVHGYNSGF
jgi:hypothetical protein